MRVIGADDIHLLLDFPSLIDALRVMFQGGCEVPARHHHRIAPATAHDAQGTLLIMPAWQPGRSLGIKIVTVFPDNTRRLLPSVHGTYLLLDAATGMPAALLDGTALTLRRTAAASALAAGFLARPDSAVHLMVGTGALAPHLIAAHAAVRPIRETRIWGRDPKKAVALAARLAQVDAAAIIKLGRHFAKLRRVLSRLGLIDGAIYVERASLPNQRVAPLATIDPTSVPYFAMALVWRVGGGA